MKKQVGKFTLSISTALADAKYVLNPPSRDVQSINFVSGQEDAPHPRFVTFFNTFRSDATCHITMVDAMTGRPLPDRTPTGEVILDVDRLVCRWCTMTIGEPETRLPVGVPVDWVAPQRIHSYQSEVSRDVFTIKENICSASLPQGEAFGGGVVQSRPGHFKCRWAFCSMNCVLAFALENQHAAEYSRSVSLTHRLYAQLFPEKKDKLLPSHHWSTLKKHGGFLTTEAFMMRIGHVVYLERGNVELPIFKTYGTMVEEKICFTN